jgi:hypothetical protein
MVPFARKLFYAADAVPPLLLAGLLEDRLESVYKADPRYSDKATSMFNIDLGAPEVGRRGQGGGLGADADAAAVQVTDAMPAKKIPTCVGLTWLALISTRDTRDASPHDLASDLYRLCVILRGCSRCLMRCVARSGPLCSCRWAT